MIRDLLMSQNEKNKIAVFENDMAVSYDTLAQKANGLMAKLTESPQGNVAILLPNGGDFISALWGTIGAGMTAFPLNIMMTENEVIPLLKQADATTLITSHAYESLVKKTMGSNLLLHRVIFMEEVAPVAEVHKIKKNKVDSKVPMVLLNTSGTTGKCKIVMLTEENMNACVLGYLDKLSLEQPHLQDARFTLAVPFSSAYGIMILSACLLQAVPIVVLGQEFTLDALYQGAQKNRITHYEGSASPLLLMEQLSGREIPYDISSLTCFGFGGSKISGETINNILKQYPRLKLYQGYGMTEASPLIAKHSHNVPIKADSVGTTIKGMDIAIATENELTNAPNVMGEIVVKGPSVMAGYYNDEVSTNQAIQGGYLYTGDIGYLDKEGYLFICGRKKNIIIVRGFNVYPEEVEECIYSSALVHECHVYGIQDGRDNEAVAVDIVPADGQIQEAALRAHCTKYLASYKQPQYYRFCDFIKKNTSGKIDRQWKGSQ